MIPEDVKEGKCGKKEEDDSGQLKVNSIKGLVRMC
jgi:hypothetical protein